MSLWGTLRELRLACWHHFIQ